MDVAAPPQFAKAFSLKILHQHQIEVFGLILRVNQPALVRRTAKPAYTSRSVKATILAGRLKELRAQVYLGPTFGSIFLANAISASASAGLFCCSNAIARL
jgi:hypothetical protein